MLLTPASYASDFLDILKEQLKEQYNNVFLCIHKKYLLFFYAHCFHPRTYGSLAYDIWYGQNMCVRVEILTTKVTLLLDRAFGRQVGHVGRSFMNGTGAFIKEVDRVFLASFAM